MSDIATLLREEGWDLPQYNIGEYECLCPFCSHLRKPIHKNVKCAKVWIVDDNFATYCCQNCGKTGYVKPDNYVYKPAAYTKPEIKPQKNINIADEFLKKRGISKETADLLGWFVNKDEICFPFYKYDSIVNVKYRGIKEKKFRQEPNPEPVLYNYDNALKELQNNNGTLIIVEGEIDCATFVEAGFKCCVSLPSGSDAQVREKGYQGAKFDFIKCSLPLINSAKRIVLALDNDATGQAMTQSLINMLPKGKVFLVDWSVYPVQGKDANDFWLQDKNIIKDAMDKIKLVGGNKITQAIDDPSRLEKYMINGIQGGYKTGFDGLDKLVTFMPGDFVSITGYPGSGKSQWLMHLMLNMVKKHDLNCLYCAFENPRYQIVGKLLQNIIGEETYGATLETIKKCREYYAFINKHFMLLDDTAEILSIDNLLANIQAVIVQHNIDMIIIDPFNKLEFSRSKDQSGDIGVVLNKLIAFTHKNNVLMFLVAHPTKPNSEKRKIGGQEIPSGFDIAGSANFQNMSDAVISVHRQQDEEGKKSSAARVTVSKWRFGERGREGSVYFKYNTRTARYWEISKNEYLSETKTQHKEPDTIVPDF